MLFEFSLLISNDVRFSLPCPQPNFPHIRPCLTFHLYLLFLPVLGAGSWLCYSPAKVYCDHSVITLWSQKDVITLWSQIYFVIMIRSKCDHRSITTIWCDHNCDHNYILWSQYTLWFSCDLVVITTFDVFYSRNHKSLLWSQITVVITTLTCQNHKSLFTGLLHIIYYQN